MSLVTVSSEWSSVNPKIWFEGKALHIRTNLFLQILGLFFWEKTVIVDPTRETFTIQKRYLWFLQSAVEIPFRDVSHFEYGYSSLPTSWSITGATFDRLESYSVALALHDRSEVPLFSFRGSGAVNTGALGVLLGDSLVDCEGVQRQESRAFIDLLQDLTEKGLSKYSNRKYRRQSHLGY
ncbi:MAG TPA: hypothetical protein VM580_00805 [Labilithrix sp.]|jgi:hypothetical protein|nr:hypothetical protein [Labilithrix sp.]